MLNGRLPGAMLAAIPGTSRRLALELLPQTIALREDFAAHFGKPLYVTDGYRTYEEQVFLKKQKGPFAATPGTSVHGWGKALDLGSGVNDSFTSREHLWMRANGPRYGWHHPAWAHNHNPSDGQDEPWHFEGIQVPRSSYRRPADPLEDDVSQQDVILALHSALSQAAARDTPYGRQVGDALRTIMTGIVVNDGPDGASAAATAQAVWATTVARGTEKISALQELADAKTLALATQATLKNLPAAVVAALPATSGGAGVTPAQVEEAVRKVLRDGVA